MRDNLNVAIRGAKVALVPYRHKFVETYHNWMKDPHILEMTASEPLSIEEEYEMQKSWRDDANKCTFIILAESPYNSVINTDKEISCMAGDVNLFLNDYEDKSNAEIEIMIAEVRHRKKGFAREALELMMAYGVKHLHITRFYAKISKENSISRQLFMKLGFVEVNYVAAFDEFEYEYLVGTSELGQSSETSGKDSSNRDIILKRAQHADTFKNRPLWSTSAASTRIHRIIILPQILHVPSMGAAASTVSVSQRDSSVEILATPVTSNDEFHATQNAIKEDFLGELSRRYSALDVVVLDLSCTGRYASPRDRYFTPRIHLLKTPERNYRCLDFPAYEMYYDLVPIEEGHLGVDHCEQKACGMWGRVELQCFLVRRKPVNGTNLVMISTVEDNSDRRVTQRICDSTTLSTVAFDEDEEFSAYIVDLFAEEAFGIGYDTRSFRRRVVPSPTRGQRTPFELHIAEPTASTEFSSNRETIGDAGIDSSVAHIPLEVCPNIASHFESND